MYVNCYPSAVCIPTETERTSKYYLTSMMIVACSLSIFLIESLREGDCIANLMLFQKQKIAKPIYKKYGKSLNHFHLNLNTCVSALTIKNKIAKKKEQKFMT